MRPRNPVLLRNRISQSLTVETRCDYLTFGFKRNLSRLKILLLIISYSACRSSGQRNRHRRRARLPVVSAGWPPQAPLAVAQPRKQRSPAPFTTNVQCLQQGLSLQPSRYRRAYCRAHFQCYNCVTNRNCNSERGAQAGRPCSLCDDLRKLRLIASNLIRQGLSKK